MVDGFKFGILLRTKGHDYSRATLGRSYVLY